jgi:hypothetical protein
MLPKARNRAGERMKALARIAASVLLLVMLGRFGVAWGSQGRVA